MQINSVNTGKSEFEFVANGRRPVRDEAGRGDGHLVPDKHREAQFEEREVIKAIQHANRALHGVYTQFEFSIHEKTKEIMVKVIDRDSGEVIRDIPPEHILDMVAKMWELAGILVDERV